MNKLGLFAKLVFWFAAQTYLLKPYQFVKPDNSQLEITILTIVRLEEGY